MRVRGVADNVAIWPEFVDRFLRLKLVSYVLVEAAEAAAQSCSVISLAQASEFNGDEIVWGPAIEEDKNRRGRIAFENGRYCTRWARQHHQRPMMDWGANLREELPQKGGAIAHLKTHGLNGLWVTCANAARLASAN
jgi:hypothetical protein